MKPIFRFLFVAAIATVIAACGPRENRHDRNNPNNNTQNQSMSQNTGGRHHSGKLRRICANDIQKLCSGQQKVRRCLRDNSDKLEPACNTALQQAIERRRERRQRQNNSNSTNTNTTPTQGQQPAQQNTQPQNQTNGQTAKPSDDDDDDDD